ncbi:MAG: Rho termination factor N-terminal domain-containing protein [Pseudanabaena sp. M38BS1SP1A06MG]|nr:Rho termination factor N-terminal domain-containing protein [Pseudanabaena sp. M53BS1SP1A06MG]MCA6592838.1 Rho termination factor N-terminal domain-containing protein [Pseudanabaena sp. M38BS1SP1A06MG]
MKTQPLTKTAIEAVITISLIAIMGLLTVLIYTLLSLLGNEPTNQSLLTSQIEAPETIVQKPATIKARPETTAALPSAKAAPSLELVQEAKTEIIASATTKPLTKMTVQELRFLARERKIPNWRKLKKKELLLYLTI